MGNEGVARAAEDSTVQEVGRAARGPAGLQDYNLKMEEKAYRMADDLLGHPPTAEQLLQAAGSVEQAIDNQVYRFAGKLEILHQQGLSPNIACRKGCSYCCGTQIMCTIPEAARLADWINENLSQGEIVALKERLAEFVAKLLAIKASGEARPPIDCPILVDNSCSCHPARPIACRGANSLDVDACINARENWRDQTLNIPLLGQPLYAAKAMVKGIRRALADRGIASPVVEMPLALNIILDNPKAIEGYLAGEPVFETAIVGGPLSRAAE